MEEILKSKILTLNKSNDNKTINYKSRSKSLY